MKILVIGKGGQVATELALLPDTESVGRDRADLTDPEACAAVILNSDCDAVINAAAYTAVDKAEEEEALAVLINAEAPGAMARACAQKNIPFIHISTDYVFAGEGTTAFCPEDPTGPLGAYGRTKLAGEEKIEQAGGSFAIIRTSWVVSSHGNNFIKTMLRLGQSRDALSIVGDQIGGPTPAAALAKATRMVAQCLITSPEKSGIYHLSGTPDTSWADFAKEIFRQAELTVAVTDIPTRDYPTPATRPGNSRMNCDSIKAQFNIDRPDWRADLTHILNALKKQELIT
ncbi:dTDP-4-dehydrorhamnose reductase [Cohaesibacter celericrescens]|uniref:dTDP-4-dehydrorhamnose reductase n=1 Tax=Cohaesibacter celericrescens TaxID=2067669 RepID=UPI003564E968